jgi:Xaa-Pro aminopeptidase
VTNWRKIKPRRFSRPAKPVGRAVGEKNLDGYFFSGASDLYYLTGFHSEGFYGLATGRGVWLFVSALLAGQVRESAPGCRLVVGKRLSVVGGSC